MNRKVVYPIGILLGGLALAFLISINRPELVEEPYERIVPTVRVMNVQATAEYLSIKSQGTVQPRSQSEVIPEVTGRVTWLSPSLVNGGAFLKDDVLLRIDDAD